MCAGSNNFAFHQEYYLFKMPYRCNFLCNRYKCQTGIIVFEVAEDLVFSLLVDTGGEIVKQEDLRIYRKSTCKHYPLFLPARKTGTPFRNNCIELLRQ